MTAPETIKPDALRVYNAASCRWLEAFILAAISIIMEKEEEQTGTIRRYQEAVEHDVAEWAMKFWEIDKPEAEKIASKQIGIAIAQLVIGQPMHDQAREAAEWVTQQGWTPGALMQLSMAATPGA